MHMPSPTLRNGAAVRLSLCDLSWALVSPIVGLYLRDTDIVFRSEWGVAGFYWLTTAGFSLVGFLVFRIREGITAHFSLHDALDVVKAVVLAELMTCIVLFMLTRLVGIPRSTPLIHGLLLAIGLMAIRLFVRFMHRDDIEPSHYHSRCERIILIGANRFSSHFIKMLHAYIPQKQRVIAVLDENAAMVGRAIAGVRILGAPQQLDAIITEFDIHGVGTERVVIAGERDFLSHAALREVQRSCEKRQIDLSFLPRMLGVTEPSGLAAINPQAAAAFVLPSYFWLKRWLDIIGSLTLIVLSLPFLTIASLLAFFDVGSPILFWQERVGRNGRPFLIYKFRTLRPPFDSDGGSALESRQPSAVGRLLRRTRIDELPQLLNVLFGDMALIGPRPLLPEDQPPNAGVRLMVRPGITGWAQVNGAKLVTKEEKGKLDEWYIRHASLRLDLRIARMTLELLLKSHVSSEEASVDDEQIGRRRRARRRAGQVQEVSALERPISISRISHVPALLTSSTTMGPPDATRPARPSFR